MHKYLYLSTGDNSVVRLFVILCDSHYIYILKRNQVEIPFYPYGPLFTLVFFGNFVLLILIEKKNEFGHLAKHGKR